MTSAKYINKLSDGQFKHYTVVLVQARSQSQVCNNRHVRLGDYNKNSKITKGVLHIFPKTHHMIKCTYLHILFTDSHNMNYSQTLM